MFRYLEKFEELISRALLLMMAAVVLLTTIELGWILAKDVLTPRHPCSCWRSMKFSSCLACSC